jgi:hypothetical protein
MHMVRNLGETFGEDLLLATGVPATPGAQMLFFFTWRFALL